MRSPLPVFRFPVLLAVLVLFLPAASAAWAADAPLPVKKAAGSIELADPAGDVEPIHSSGDKDYPGYDVVKLALASDGKALAIAATLHDAPGVFASDVLEIFFDTDSFFPGHRPAASALGFALPARWAGLVRGS